MMPVLLFHFPAKRYHATPWGSHVNEGLVEWPPSPWRLIRALVSVGYTSGLWGAEGPTPVARSLFEALSATLPRYRLPPASGAHSRHYMSLARFKKQQEDTTLVFDTWAHIATGELSVSWDVSVSDDERALLSELAQRLGYLGRSESWVTARIAEQGEALPPGQDCFAAETGGSPGPGWEQVALMAPLPPVEYGAWRQQAVDQALEVLQQERALVGKKPNKAQCTKAIEPFPEDLIAGLQTDTNWLRKQGWSQPPAARRVLYWRPINALEPGAPRAFRRQRQAEPVEAMLLAIGSASRSRGTLPSVTRTLPQGELLHRALVSQLKGAHCQVLNGCDGDGQRLRGPHQHAHLLHLDLDDDGYLDHVLVWAPMGLDGPAQRAVRAVRTTYAKGGVGPLRLAMVGAGALCDLTRASGLIGSGMRRLVGDGCVDSRWVSLTPFVPPRYLKQRGRNAVRGQIEAELASRGMPPPTSVEILNPGDHALAARQRHSVRVRRSGPAPKVNVGLTLSLRFSEPLQGPVCLGYGSHFGLGLFARVEDNS